MVEHSVSNSAASQAAIHMDLESMRSESLRNLWVSIFVLGLLWVVYAIFVTPGAPFSTLIPPAGLLAISTATFGMNQRWPAWNRRMFVIQLDLLLLLYLFISPNTLGIFFSLPIIVASNILLDRRWMLGLAAGLLLGLLLLLMREPAMLGLLYGAAVTINLITIFGLWLSTDNLYTAVAWAMYSQHEAQQHLDIARQRQSELGRLTTMLSQNQERLHYLNLRLEQARVSAEEAYRTKQHFVANVSHELRTPLNLITGFSEMMAFSPESYGGVALPASYREDVMEIYRSSKHLLALVEDVLALAQLEAGKMLVKREPADLAAVINEAAETMRPLMEAKGLALVIEHATPTPPILMDSGRIRQILLNLLNNAYRFTESGGIYLRTEVDAEGVHVRVRDTGVGIAEAEIPHIFQEFHSLSGGPTARRDGFGLGLSISRRLAEAHGGSLMVESNVGQGSVFCLTLPLGGDIANAGRLALVRTAPGAKSEQSRPVILVLGPDQSARSTLARFMTEYRIVHAEPWQVVSLYEHYLPVAIWINDTTVNGGIPRGLTQALQSIPSVPVFVCRVPSLDDAAHRLNVDHILAKPVTLAKLEDALHQVGAQGPCRVLVVDDDPRMVRLVSRTLTSMPNGPAYEIVKACGGAEGIAMFDQEHPDLVLLDLAMPDVSGYDVLDHLHSSGLEARVVLMTGVDLSEDESPIYSISVFSNTGFSLLRSFKAVHSLIEDLSGRPTQV